MPKEKHICVGHNKPSGTGASAAVALFVLKDALKCTSNATIFENEKWYCKRHAPSKIAEREDKAWKRYIAKINNSSRNGQ